MQNELEKSAIPNLQELGDNLPEDLKKALPYLLIGGGGALLGGLATGGRHHVRNESGTGYAARIAKNMALAGLLAGGGAYALHRGVGDINKSIDYENPRTGDQPELNPVASGLRGLAFSPLTAAAAGGGALLSTMPKIDKQRGDVANMLFKDTDKNLRESALSDAESMFGENKLSDRIKGVIGKPGAEEALNRAGIATMGSKLGPDAGVLEKALAGAERVYRPTAGRLLGQSLETAAGRGALGAGAALLPAVLGSILTDPVKQQ